MTQIKTRLDAPGASHCHAGNQEDTPATAQRASRREYVKPTILTQSAQELDTRTVRVNACTSYSQF